LRVGWGGRTMTAPRWGDRGAVYRGMLTNVGVWEG
jgi:hypothetical protein